MGGMGQEHGNRHFAGRNKIHWLAY